MKNSEVKLPFGYNKENDLVHVRDVESGKKCGCVCPGCRSPLIAAKGSKLQHHFKHDVGKECENGLESAIHKAAKKMLMERKQIALPEYIAKIESRDSRGETYIEQQMVVQGGNVIEFDTVIEEVSLNEMKADILATKKQATLIIEICCTHKVDEQKLQKIESAKVSAIEIDLSDLTAKDLIDWESFWQSINDPHRIKWLHNAKASASVLPNLKKKLENKIQLKEKKIKLEAEERQRRFKKESDDRKRKEEKETSEILRSLDELKQLTSQEHIGILKSNAEATGSLEFNSKKIPLNELPNYLNVEVPFGDWIFGCDRRVWQTAVYNFFICKSDKTIFSILEVLEWLRVSAKCKAPRAAVVISKHGKSYPWLLTGFPEGYPSSWRTLVVYFDHLWRLGVLIPLFEGSKNKRNRYMITSKVPAGGSTLVL